MRWLFFLALISACGQVSPTAPTAQQTVAPTVATIRPTWGLSGQSNADFLRPYLAPYADVIGFSESSRPISWWNPDGYCWLQLAPTLHTPMSAFIWWQGESDNYTTAPGEYAAALTELVGRIRAEANAPRLLFVVMRIADARMDAEQDRFLASDAYAMAVQTRDIGFVDGTHMSAEQYGRLAVRLAQLLGAPLP